jgi:hypothetical protein
VTTRETYLEAERIRKARIVMERDAVELQIRLNATPATIKNLRRSVPDKLFAGGKITSEQFKAALEILGIFEAITSGLNARTSSFDARVDRSHSVNDWRPGLSRAYTERYIPWREEAGLVMLRDRACLADLTLDVVVNNLGLSQSAQLWGMSRDRVLRELRKSLHRYAEIAGWIEIKSPCTR